MVKIGSFSLGAVSAGIGIILFVVGGLVAGGGFVYSLLTQSSVELLSYFIRAGAMIFFAGLVFLFLSMSADDGI